MNRHQAPDVRRFEELARPLFEELHDVQAAIRYCAQAEEAKRAAPWRSGPAPTDGATTPALQARETMLRRLLADLRAAYGLTVH